MGSRISVTLLTMPIWNRAGSDTMKARLLQRGHGREWGQEWKTGPTFRNVGSLGALQFVQHLLLLLVTAATAD
jgi:hypothetical protein